LSWFVVAVVAVVADGAIAAAVAIVPNVPVITVVVIITVIPLSCKTFLEKDFWKKSCQKFRQSDNILVSLSKQITYQVSKPLKSFVSSLFEQR
jgi:hypothetical protein